MKKLKRIAEILGGSALVILGVVMIFTPGQGLLAIIAGVMLVSPHHGRRLIWWLKQLWRGVKGWWYSWRFKRVVKKRVLNKAKALKRKLKVKK